MQLVRHNTKLQLGVIFGLTLLAYLDIFPNQFVWDDRDFILGWPQIQNVNHIPELLAGGLPARHGGVYRPVRSLLYVGAYALLGENVMGYHVLSLVVHLVVTLLIYLITIKIAGKTSLAFYTALLFGVHPIHTEAVTYITTNFDLWGMVFLLASLFAYLRSTETSGWQWRTTALVLAGLATFTYEIALALPLMILGYEWLYRKQRWPQIARTVLPYAALSVGYFAVRTLLDTTVGRSAPLLGGSLYLHILTIVKILARYVSITIWPANLTVYPPLTPAHGIADTSVLLSLAFIAAIAAGAVLAYRQKLFLIPFGVIIFFSALLPVAQIVPAKIVLAERYLYLASFGFCLVLGWLSYWIAEQKKPAGTYLAAGLIAALASVYIYGTWQRNLDWRNVETLWSKTVTQVPQDARARHNYGAVLYQQGNYAQAVTVLQHAAALDPRWPEAHNTLGQALAAQERYDEAITALERALELEPRYLDAIRNLGDAYLGKEAFAEATDQYQKYLKLEPDDAEVYNNLALAQLNLGQHDFAEQNFSQALKLNPALAPARLGLAITFMAQKKYAPAQGLLRDVLAADPHNIAAKEKMMLLEQLLRQGSTDTKNTDGQ